MAMQIELSVVEALGGEQALAAAVAAFTQAVMDHAYTVDVPAPTAHPLVERIVRDHAGAFEVVYPPEPEELPEQEPEETPMTKISKDVIWRRATDDEAELMEQALQSQPVRLRRIYEGATFISTTDELYGMLDAALVQLFGTERAAELLEPTDA